MTHIQIRPPLLPANSTQLQLQAPRRIRNRAQLPDKTPTGPARYSKHRPSSRRILKRFSALTRTSRAKLEQSLPSTLRNRRPSHDLLTTKPNLLTTKVPVTLLRPLFRLSVVSRIPILTVMLQASTNMVVRRQPQQQPHRHQLVNMPTIMPLRPMDKIPQATQYRALGRGWNMYSKWFSSRLTAPRSPCHQVLR